MPMSTVEHGGSRLRAYTRFVIAILFFFFARALARRGAAGIANDQWAPLAGQAVLAALLLFGYAAFGIVLDRQTQPISRQGFPLRPGWFSETGMGLAMGWAVAVACILPMVAIGGIAIVLNLQPSAWAWLVADTMFFALAALAEELAFRGYGFQRFADSVGPVGASLGFAAFYAVMQALLPGSSRASVAVALALNLLLSTAYIRTRGLWLSWGLNFGWKASRALVFGLAVSGVSSHSPVIEGDPMGPFWLTGGGFGLDGSWWAFLVLLAALPIMFSITRDLNFRHNAPDIVPGGVPVDLGAEAGRVHESATGPIETVAAPLVQILPASGSSGVESEQPPSGQAIQQK